MKDTTRFLTRTLLFTAITLVSGILSWPFNAQVSPALGFAACQTHNSFNQPESRDHTGKITVEASIIHVLTCPGAGGYSRQVYIYQYLNRHGFRAINPPDWGHPIGGRDFQTFEEAMAVAATGGQRDDGKAYGGWGTKQDGSINQGDGKALTYYPGTTAEQCQADCDKNPQCVAFTLIKAGAFGPNDPPMCYLMSEAKRITPSSCCITAIKGDSSSTGGDDCPPGRIKLLGICSDPGPEPYRGR